MRKVVILAVAVMLVICTSFQSPAQEMSRKVLTIDDCVKIALKNSFASRSAQLNYQSAKWDFVGSWSGFLPSIDFSSNWSRRGERTVSTDFFGQKVDEIAPSVDQYIFSFDLTQPIYNGGANFANYNLKRYGKRSAWDDLKLAEQSVALNVKQGCYDLLKAQMLYDVQKDAVDKSIEQLKMAKARYDLGAASLSDYLKAKVQLGNDSLSLITNENSVKLAEATLNSLLGLDVNTPLEIDAKLEYKKLETDLEGETSRALDKHPQIDKARMGVNQAHSSLTVARSDYYPAIAFSWGYNWSNVRFPESINDWKKFVYWDVGISVRLNLFGGFLTASKARSDKAQLNLSKESLEQSKRDLALAIKRAYLSVKGAEQKILLTQDALTSAEEDLKLTQEKYNLGAASILDLLNANFSYKTAKSNQVQALYDYNLAVAQFEKATGK